MLKNPSIIVHVLIIIGLIVLCQLYCNDAEAQSRDTFLINELKEAKAKLLFEVSSNATFVPGPGSYLYKVENFINLFDQGRIMYYAKVDGKFKRVSRNFNWQIGEKLAPAIYVYKDALNRIVFAHENLNENKYKWGGTIEYYFNSDGSLLASAIWGAQQVASDDFDEIRITRYLYKGKLIETERKCYGSSQTCRGWEQLKFSPGDNVSEWFTSKGINLADKSIHDR